MAQLKKDIRRSFHMVSTATPPYHLRDSFIMESIGAEVVEKRTKRNESARHLVKTETDWHYKKVVEIAPQIKYKIINLRETEYDVPELPMNKDIFTEDFLEEIGFKEKELEPSKFSEPGQYGHAIDIRTNGMTHLRWNLKGPGTNYFGDHIEPGAIDFSIGKDGGTRTAFAGHIWTQDDIRELLRFTW